MTRNALDSVPSWVAQTFFGPLEADVATALEDCGVQVGNRVELDLVRAEAVLGGELTAALRAYDERCRDFWTAVLAGEEPGPYVLVRRALLDVRQQDNKKARVDLNAQLEACAQIPLLAEIAEQATAAAVDWDELCRLGAQASLSLEQNGNETVLELELSPSSPWPDELGGVASNGEISRRVELTVNHAAWRDRKNRRLVAVRVWADEIWPDPQAA